MNGTSKTGSSPIANAARQGSTAATTAAIMIPTGTIAVVTKPTTRVRNRVGVNSSASGTAITATPATPAPTTTRSAAMYHHPPSGASASAPVASENMRIPAISGRRRPMRSPARPQMMLPAIAPTPAASSITAASPNVRSHSSARSGTTNAIRKKSNRSSTAPTITAPARM
jgi:hypothetical protein